MHIRTGSTVLLFLAGLTTVAWCGQLAEPGSLLEPGSQCGEPFILFIRPASVDTPAIVDAWTTKYPFSMPEEECYEFVRGVDTLAFVVKYLHAGGQIPKQFGQAYECGSDQGRKNCIFPWTVSAPPGVYLLINFYPVCRFNPGSFDWAAKVGTLVYGFPDPASNRPECFDIVEPLE